MTVNLEEGEKLLAAAHTDWVFSLGSPPGDDLGAWLVSYINTRRYSACVHELDQVDAEAACWAVNNAPDLIAEVRAERRYVAELQDEVRQLRRRIGDLVSE